MASQRALAHVQEALSCFQSGRLEEADRSCRQALDLDPEHLDALVIHGHVLARLGRIEEGLRCGAEASRIAPKQS